MSSENLIHRSEYLRKIFDKYVDKEWTVLEVGSGDNRNVDYLNQHGYNVIGIDKLHGTSIQDFPEKEFDVIFTMSTLFLIPPEEEWVFEKIARMARKYIITVEGETSSPRPRDSLYGRDYTYIFEPFGFKEVEKEFNVFNQYGVLRVLKNDKKEN